MKHNDKTVRCVFRTRDILIAASIIAAGVLLALIPSLSWLGITLLVCEACIIPFGRTGYKLKGVEGLFTKKDIILPIECKHEIASYIEGKSDTLNIEPFKKGGLLMEIYKSKDGSRLFGQTFSYENCHCSPQCELSEISYDKLERLKQFE